MEALKPKCMRGASLLFLTVAALQPATASVDHPDVRGWSGTAYHEGGWLSYQLPAPYEASSPSYPGGAARFDRVGEFMISPPYPEPVRKVLIKAACSSASPTRILQLAPFVGGVETNSPVALDVPAEDAAQVFEFSPSDGVTAFRLFLGGSGSTGVWGVSDVCVFYGEKTGDEDAVLLEFASQLPSPGNLRAAEFSETSLTVAADAVEGASGYRFEIFRLDGTPRTASCEGFAAAPSLSADGWTFGAIHNASLKMASSSYLDCKTSADEGALKIEKGSGSGQVSVEVVSPEFSAPVSEVSYASKRSSGESCSDTVTVFGRASDSSGWVELAEPFEVSTSQRWTTNAVAAAGIRQIKFVFTAEADTFRPCGIDTLRVVYGGDETRTSVSDDTEVHASPEISLSGLQCARYAFRVQAAGGEGGRDSSWSDEQVVDLAWAGVFVSAPDGVSAVSSGDSVTVSWNAVASAALYRVTVRSADDPDAAPVVSETTETSAEVPVPETGDYWVSVTAESPGGMSSATSDSVHVAVLLGSPDAVNAEAVDVSELSASWTAVPLAEGYRVSLCRVLGGGEPSLERTVYVTACTATFDGLDPSASYLVEVVPQPSDGTDLGAVSEIVDMSAAHFRRTGAVPFRGSSFEESFVSLSDMSGDTDLKSVHLDYWQFLKGAAEPGSLLLTSGISRTTGGVYAFCDSSRSPGSFALGTLATGTYGCAFGIALVNDDDAAVDGDMTLGFVSIQRSYRTNAATYALEWKVTDGDPDIGSDGGWTAVAIPETAPYAAADENRPDSEYRQQVSVAVSLGRRLLRGEMLLFRWRHPKVSSGPMMAIDDVRLDFRRIDQATRIVVR